MGTLYQSSLSKSVTKQDLKVSLLNSTLIFPIQETERKLMFLSNIDQVLNFDVQTVHFFGENSDHPFEIVTEKLKYALSKVLVAYDFLAGRLKMNEDSGRLEIDCNRAGAGFVVAKSKISLAEIGDLVYPNPGFKQLIVPVLDIVEPNDHPLCILQVTSFKCGGFAIGLQTNHATFDGISCKLFLKNLASQAFDQENPLPLPPCNDRHLLAARSPPRVTHPHPELLKVDKDSKTPPPVFDCQEEELDFEIFRLTQTNLTRLKNLAGESSRPGIKITGFNVITAHVWRCKALSRGNRGDSTVLYAVDIRPRVVPPLPESYTGNGVLSAYATAKREELEEGPFSKIVELVYRGAERMNDEYVRSAIDWGEVYKGFPNGEFMMSSWWRLGFGNVEYPWGKPRFSCPVVYRRKDIILLFPDLDGVSDNGNGVNVLVALPHVQMEKFKSLFYKFLN